jgi:DNA-binding SARP family transcriptional activator
MALNQVGDPAALDVILRTRPWIVEANDLYALRLNFLLHGQALLRRQDLAGALEATEEAVRVARVFGLQRELGIALQQLAMIVARTGDWRRTRSLLRESLQAMRGDPMLLFICRALELMASSAVVAGDATNAGRLYGAAQSIRESIGAAMWGVDRDQHAPFIAQAKSSLGAAYAEAEAEGRAWKVDQAIDRALSVGEQLGYTTGPDRTEQTERYHTAEYPVPPSPLPAAAGPSLVVRALGGLEVLIHGAPVARRDWAYSKARELLLFLLLHPDGQTREQVGVALWPEASATQLRNNFHVALHHLRRALGHADWVRFERDRYRVDVPGGVDFDAMAFENVITSGLRAGRRGAFPVDEMRLALERYRGDFLDGESAGDWHYEMRDRLARLYGDGAEALGGALMGVERVDDAVAVLSRLSEREPLRESACRMLMSARARSGDTAGALRDYRTLEGALRRDGIPGPGRETAELYRRLQRGDAARSS